MWREENGIIEMLFSYIGEYVEFGGWQSWRNVVEEIITCHERYRQEKLTQTPDAHTTLVTLPKYNELQGFEAGTCQESTLKAKKVYVDEALMERDSFCPDDKGFHSHLGNWKGTSEQYPSLDVPTQHIKEDVEIVNESSSNRLGDEEQNARSDEGRDFIVSADHPTATSSAVRSSLESAVKSVTSTHNEFPPIERTLICQICDKTFSFQSALRRHLQLHVGNRRYQCEVCSKSFFQSGNLKRHMATHSNKQLISCPLCGKSFRQFSTLVNHQKKSHDIT